MFSTHEVAEAERYADRVLVLADGELLFDGAAAGARGATAQGGGHRDLEAAFVAFLTSGALMRSVRWLLLKDLQILRRSPLLVGLLIVYPIVIALLIGLALSRGPAKPRVAIANLVPAGQTIDVGGAAHQHHRLRVAAVRDIVPVPVSSREEAIAKVRSGDVIAALVIPPDIVAELSSGFEQAASRSSTTATRSPLLRAVDDQQRARPGQRRAVGQLERSPRNTSTRC